MTPTEKDRPARCWRWTKERELIMANEQLDEIRHRYESGTVLANPNLWPPGSIDFVPLHKQAMEDIQSLLAMVDTLPPAQPEGKGPYPNDVVFVLFNPDEKAIGVEGEVLCVRVGELDGAIRVEVQDVHGVKRTRSLGDCYLTMEDAQEAADRENEAVEDEAKKGMPESAEDRGDRLYHEQF